jgi:hypothetical protein
MNQLQNHGKGNVLNSWKDIASYLGRGVRTVQRWEQELQLPVHRIGVGNRSPVFAFEHELRFWLHATNPGNGYPAPTVASEARATRGVQISRSVKLAQRLLSAAQENRRLMIQLARGLEKMQRGRTQMRESTRGRDVTRASLAGLGRQQKRSAPVNIGPPPQRQRYAAVAD